MAMLLKATPHPGLQQILLPWSKSVSNRHAILWALSRGKLVPDNWSDANDTRLMRAVAEKWITNPEAIGPIDVADCGTALRFFTAMMATRPKGTLLFGSERLNQRPIAPLIKALVEAGAGAGFAQQVGFPPVLVHGPLTANHFRLNANESSQYVSALMLILPFIGGGQIEIVGEIASEPYITLTVEVLSEAGIELKGIGNTWTIGVWDGKQQTLPARRDWSSAAYGLEWLALGGCESVHFPGLTPDPIQADDKAREIFEQCFGVASSQDFSPGLVATREHLLTASLSPLAHDFSRGDICVVEATNFPDLVPALAATAAGLGVPLRMEGIAHLRKKESDRIEAIQWNLQQLGATVQAGPDFLAISGKLTPWTKPKTINSFGDHRVVMALAPLSLFGPIELADPEVVEKSFPNFWKEMRL